MNLPIVDLTPDAPSEASTDALDSRDFYEFCQAYRHSNLGVPEFDWLKEWIRKNATVNKSVTNPLYPGE